MNKNLKDCLKVATLSVSLFAVRDGVEVMNTLAKKAASIAVNSSSAEKRKKGLTDLPPSEEVVIKDFSNFFEMLNTQNPISMSFVDYRYLVKGEGPMSETEKDQICSYLKFQHEFSNVRVSNSRKFFEKMVHKY